VRLRPICLYPSPMSLRPRALPAGFIAPCLPIKAPHPPSGDGWLIEIKHDGFRVIARKEAKRVRLYSRPGYDLTHRFPRIVEALSRLRARSCISTGKRSRAGRTGSSFDRIRYRRHDTSAFLYAFDLIELNGDDLRREALAVRTCPFKLARRSSPWVELSQPQFARSPPRVWATARDWATM
jgi:bifunctional non-homologous end joining protein LigD